MDTKQCLHPLELVRVVVAFKKIFENKHTTGEVRMHCTGCNIDLQKDSTVYKIAIELVRANIRLIAAKE